MPATAPLDSSAVEMRLLPIVLSVSRLSQLGVSRHAAYRGLKSLEDRGLVSVDRHRGRKPVITVIEIDSGGVTVGSLSSQFRRETVLGTSPDSLCGRRGRRSR